jgi:uncharacterized lipoprotein YmbA
MEVSYMSQNLEWSSELSQPIDEHLVRPLRQHLKQACAQLVVRVEAVGDLYEMWAVLQTFDGRMNAIVRAQAVNLKELALEVSELMHEKVSRSVAGRPGFFNDPFVNLSVGRSA